MSGDPVGIDSAAVTDWFLAHIPGVTVPLAFELVLGGRSNLTYVVTDRAGGRWVLRRPPTGAVLPSAHNVLREQAILSGLAGSAVPVPAVAGHCSDPAVTGADFYVMDFVDGVILNSDDDTAALTASGPAAFSADVVAVLVHIHRIDCDRAPFAQWRRPGGYVERQLRRWGQQLDRIEVTTGALRDVARRLGRDIPAEQSVGLVHGDYRPGNLIIGPDGGVRAVLDCELCTVGDVLADLGWLVAMWDSPRPVGWAPDPAQGFAPTERILAEYQRRTGLDVGDIGYYHAFALWRLGCIAEGVYHRYRDGAMGVQGVYLDEMAARPAMLAEMAAAALRG